MDVPPLSHTCKGQECPEEISAKLVCKHFNYSSWDEMKIMYHSSVFDLIIDPCTLKVFRWLIAGVIMLCGAQIYVNDA